MDEEKRGEKVLNDCNEDDEMQVEEEEKIQKIDDDQRSSSL